MTLAAVATKVDVAVPSLYKHVSSLADLRRSVAVASVTELTTAIAGATIGRAGADALGAMADAVRTFAHEHPGRYAATQVATNPDDPADTELTESAAATVAVMAGVLRGFELPPILTIEAIRLMRSVLHGFILLELGGGFGMRDDLDRSFALVVETVIAGIERLSA